MVGTGEEVQGCGGACTNREIGEEGAAGKRLGAVAGWPPTAGIEGRRRKKAWQRQTLSGADHSGGYSTPSRSAEPW
jgi:hypothetical protein